MCVCAVCPHFYFQLTSQLSSIDRELLLLLLLLLLLFRSEVNQHVPE